MPEILVYLRGHIQHLNDASDPKSPGKWAVYVPFLDEFGVPAPWGEIVKEMEPLAWLLMARERQTFCPVFSLAYGRRYIVYGDLRKHCKMCKAYDADVNECNHSKKRQKSLEEF